MENPEIRQTTITPRFQERSVPEGNILLNSFEKLFYTLRLVTRQSRIDPGKRPKLQSERPLSLRAARAQLFKQLSSGKLSREEVIAEAHARDEIAKQYLTQGEVRVNIPNLGEQSARYTVITPPQSRSTTATLDQPPIILVPGLANDIDCVGALAQEIPYMGRKVIVIGMPESVMGKVTPEFARAVLASPTYGPHAAFYKSAIDALTNNSQIELWGHSTGCPIIAEILTDPKYQERVGAAVFLNPASSVNISKGALRLGVFNELKNLISPNLPKYTLSTAGELPETSEHKALRERVANVMLKKVCAVAEGWKDARVQAGGKIIVYSGQKDQLTRSFELFRGDQSSLDKLKQVNPQIEVIDDPKGFHTTSLIEPQRVIKEVFARQAA